MIDIDELKEVLDSGINGEYKIHEYPNDGFVEVKIYDGQIEMDTLLEINDLDSVDITIECDVVVGVLNMTIYDL